MEPQQVSSMLQLEQPPGLDEIYEDHKINDHHLLPNIIPTESFYLKDTQSLKEIELKPSARPTSSLTEIADVGPTLCNPRCNRGPFTACMMRLVAQVVVGFRGKRRGNSNLEFRKGICCSNHGVEEVLETHEQSPCQRINCVSANARDAKQTLENTTLDFGYKEINNNKSKGSVPREHIKLKPTIKHLNGGQQPTNVQSLANTQDYSQHTNVDISKEINETENQGRMLKSRQFKQFDSVTDPSDHHFAAVVQVGFVLEIFMLLDSYQYAHKIIYIRI